jgi:hypothetical protein
MSSACVLRSVAWSSVRVSCLSLAFIWFIEAAIRLHALASFLVLLSDRSATALSKSVTILVFAPSGMPSRFSISEISLSIISLGVVVVWCRKTAIAIIMFCS